MTRRGIAAAAAVVLAASWSPVAAAAGAPATISAGFDRGAAPGDSTALRVAVAVDRRRLPSPVAELRVLYPRSLGVVSGGLGLAPCNRPATEFVQVITGGVGLGGCPANAVMGYGTAVAEVRLSDGQVIPEYATFTLLSGPLENGRLRLVVYVDGQRPFGGRLVFGGEVRDARSPYGGALAVRLPQAPALNGVATVALTDLRLTVGGPAIRYYERRHGRRVAYRPEGVVLPARCPRGGFRFRARFVFEDGGRASAATAVRCPRRRAY